MREGLLSKGVKIVRNEYPRYGFFELSGQSDFYRFVFSRYRFVFYDGAAF